jgi:hypothetical protein
VDLDSKAIEELEKKHGVKVLQTPPDILKAQVVAIDKVYEAEAQKNPFFAGGAPRAEDPTPDRGRGRALLEEVASARLPPYRCPGR